MTPLALASFAVWCWLLTLHGRFWRSGPELPPATVPQTPTVVAIVPARDEALLIERTLRSLLSQAYDGPLRVTLVDDGSEDGTGSIARRIGDPRLCVVSGAPRPAGWAGKLWALHQGVAASGTPDFFLLTDADIEHDPPHLASLVAKAEAGRFDMVSEMVAVSCESLAERALIPAFVFFFQLLYPFAWVNNPLRATAAAAGGTVLIRRCALTRIGGVEAVRGALIDDVTLAGAAKAGGRIFLGHSGLARSVRPYPNLCSIWRMIARSAYAQLGFSPLLLVGTMAGMVLVWLVPPTLALIGDGFARALGAVTWVLLAVSFLPTLRRFRVSWLWAPALPAIALFYLAATIASAINHRTGAGVVWKGRAYGRGVP
jgi:hopene-associated glycosyltransferase HpnB